MPPPASGRTQSTRREFERARTGRMGPCGRSHRSGASNEKVSLDSPHFGRAICTGVAEFETAFVAAAAE